jgi:hypothetical protein
MRVGFTTENKSRDTSGYPKFRMEQKNEKRRICLIEQTPVMRRLHAVRMPVVENGRIVMETRKGKRGDYEVPMQEFVGSHLCTGDEQAFLPIDDGGKGLTIDPDNCVMCEWAQRYPDYFEAPYRRFAQHVLEYKCQPGTAKVATPFQAELKVWLYTDTRFDAIVDMVDEHGNPRGFDIIAGPCESVSWQKYQIQVGGSCEWAKTDERKALVAEIWKNNQCEDLEGQIARKPNPAFIQADVDKVLDRWAEVGRVDEDGETISGADYDDLNDLLGESHHEKKTKVDVTPSGPSPEADEDLSALLGSSAGESEVPDAAGSHVEEPATDDDDDAPSGDVADFDKLLGDLL